LAAIAAQRSKDVAGKALGMDTHQRRSGVNVPEDKRDSFFLTAIGGGAGIKMAFKAHNAEVPPARGEIGFSHFVKCEIGTHVNIIDWAWLWRWVTRQTSAESAKQPSPGRSPGWTKSNF